MKVPVNMSTIKYDDKVHTYVEFGDKKEHIIVK